MTLYNDRTMFGRQ